VSTAGRLAAFLVLLAVVTGAGLGAGRLIDPGTPGGAGEPAPMGGHGAMAAADGVRGLAVADDGLRLRLATPEIRRGRETTLRFRIAGEDGRAVRDFDVTHTERMHLIVVRRDMVGFQHLHPAMASDGTWSTPIRLDAAGSYRAFADFSHDGTTTTLATDLRVDGDADLVALPAPAATARSTGGYDVRLSGDPARDGEEAHLSFAVTRAGRPVAVQPYLGAGGHLVALREGDLAFLHVHPLEQAGTEGRIAFETTFPTAGRYRLFLQFRVGGEVETVAFTRVVS
jgi:hypothetical protein